MDLVVESDAIFWDRIIDMPAWEAEQELVLRRERLISENEELGLRRRFQGDAFGVKMAANSRLVSLINERIKYLRNLQAKVQWKAAVTAVLGQEAYNDCVDWIEQQYGHMDQRRREWKMRKVA